MKRGGSKKISNSVRDKPLNGANGLKVTYITKTIIISIIFLAFCFFSVTPAKALSIMVHVPEKYTDVEAGERFYFEIEIKYPENPTRKDLRLNYNIVNEDGKTIAQAKHLKAIETQASFMDFIVIPESAEKGLHVIKVTISDYESLSEEVEASFNVMADSSNQIQMYFFILLGAISFVGLLVIINIITVRRKG